MIYTLMVRVPKPPPTGILTFHSPDRPRWGNAVSSVPIRQPPHTQSAAAQHAFAFQQLPVRATGSLAKLSTYHESDVLTHKTSNAGDQPWIDQALPSVSSKRLSACPLLRHNVLMDHL